MPAWLTARLLAVWIGAALLAAGGTAAAQRPASESPSARAAKQQFELGERAYEQGRYAEAIEAFTRAHALDPAPILLFNIAQAHWKKGDPATALGYYRRYLEADPAAPDRAQVEARIRELEAERAAESSERPAPSLPPSPSIRAPSLPERAPEVQLAAAPPPPPLHR